tara:strand:+ start:665 stop:1180 length:516 start_codon:yes stop_codon:yes gene_type:complete
MALKEYCWNKVKNLTNNFSSLAVNNLGNGFIRCSWKISPLDQLKIKLTKSCFFAIRLFDITNERNKINGTCIMKEVQVSQFQSSFSFFVPINKGVYSFEFGYRKRNGEWRKLAYQHLNLGYRIKKVLSGFDQDNWFTKNNLSKSNRSSIHESAYQLSLNRKLGGSENISSE